MPHLRHKPDLRLRTMGVQRKKSPRSRRHTQSFVEIARRDCTAPTGNASASVETARTCSTGRRKHGAHKVGTGDWESPKGCSL